MINYILKKTQFIFKKYIYQLFILIYIYIYILYFEDYIILILYKIIKKKKQNK